VQPGLALRILERDDEDPAGGRLRWSEAGYQEAERAQRPDGGRDHRANNTGFHHRVSEGNMIFSVQVVFLR
jgi:hypothetical protein